MTGTIASETVQKLANQKVEDTAITCQLTKTANCIATPMRKHIQQFITCLLEIQVRFLFFPDINKNE